MASIQVKNVPEKLYKRLRRYAREQDCPLSEIILQALEKEVERREAHALLEADPHLPPPAHRRPLRSKTPIA